MDTLIALPLVAASFAETLSMIENTLSVVLGLGMVIFFHELGHFAVAKWCNVHVERFSIGIGPILWSRQKGETEYALSALPLGGYVKMLGQDDMDPNQMTSSEIAENPRSYSSKTVLQRMAIISAGVIMNVLTGYLFFVFGYWSGIQEPSPVVGAVRSGFPAWEAGIRAGDRITEVNGDRIRSFIDLQEAILLSSGDISLRLLRADGTDTTVNVTPMKSSPGRSIGVAPTVTTELVRNIPDPALISDADMPLDRASESFLPADRVVAVRPASLQEAIPVELLPELRSLLGRYADQELTYIVERPSADPAQPDAFQTVEIKVPAQNVRSTGFWMAMGPIRAIQKDSVAARAGLKVGDTIRSVDGKTPGEDIDPLYLPVYFAGKAGQPVTLVIDRSSSNGPSTEEVTVVPEDLPGWTDSPDHRAAPLTIPAIGIGYQVQTRIARVLPGSEAEKLGVFAPSTKITRIELIHRNPGQGKPDAFGDAETPVELDLSTETSKDIGTEKEFNWAWAFDQLQRAPGRKILVHYQNGDQTGSKTLETLENDPDWFLWIRGFNAGVWNDERELQKAGAIGEALSLGLSRTRKSAVSIYRSLRQIVRGDVAMESFSGPLGIAKIGYMVADRGLVDLFMFLGFLSINLAILNFLPIPILDGGHMVFLLWEGITRNKPNPQVINWAHAVGMIFLLSLFAFVMWIDIFVSNM